MLDRGTQAVEAFGPGGCNCAQAVLVAFADALGVTPATAKALGRPFGGGVAFCGRTCGAMTGGAMVLGALRGEESAAAFVERFRSRFGSTDCRDLLQVDLGAPGGSEAAQDNNLFDILCPEFVRTAATIIETTFALDSGKEA